MKAKEAGAAAKPGGAAAEQMPLAMVSAIYTIENPTDAEVEVEFGFPVLRGMYMTPYSMMPQPDVRVQLDKVQVRADVISNSAIYGIIRARRRRRSIRRSRGIRSWLGWWRGAGDDLCAATGGARRSRRRWERRLVWRMPWARMRVWRG